MRGETLTDNARRDSGRAGGRRFRSLTACANSVFLGDGEEFLRSLPSESVSLVYVDPPFNTGKRQERRRLRCRRVDDNEVEAGEAGERVYRGFGGNLHRREEVARLAYDDRHADYMGWLGDVMAEVRRVLKAEGSLFLHLDFREAHYAKVMLDRLFGRDCFQNEIVWTYDFGGRSKRHWPRKHDSIFWYSKDPRRYCFDYAAIDRIPYMAPGLVGERKALRGKTPTDVWWQTIVPTQGHERTGYPTQKPLALAERIVRVHSSADDWVLDCFAGSGTLGEAAAKHGRRFLLCDKSEQAFAIMRRRLSRFDVDFSNLPEASL